MGLLLITHDLAWSRHGAPVALMYAGQIVEVASAASSSPRRPASVPPLLLAAPVRRRGESRWPPSPAAVPAPSAGFGWLPFAPPCAQVRLPERAAHAAEMAGDGATAACLPARAAAHGRGCRQAVGRSRAAVGPRRRARRRRPQTRACRSASSVQGPRSAARCCRTPGSSRRWRVSFDIPAGRRWRWWASRLRQDHHRRGSCNCCASRR